MVEDLRKKMKDQRRLVWSWVLYDWANSAFATTVMAGFFPLFFKQYWSHNLDVSESTFYLGVANSGASFTLALLAPFLGALSDQEGLKKWFLGFFTGLGVMGTAGLFFIPAGDFQTAALTYALAALGFAGSQIFYDALLVHIVSPKRLHWVSALGYSIGYLGGGLLFAVNVVMYLKPEIFGLQDGVSAIKASFLSVSVWWAVFSIPLFLFVPESGTPRFSQIIQSASQAWQSLVENWHRAKQVRSVWMFLLAYLFYIDGVNTTVKMAVDYGSALGFEAAALIIALLVVQAIGFPAALGFGWVGSKLGPLKGIFVCIFVYAAVVIFASTMTHENEFYAMAVAIGCVQGGIQSLSRSYFATLIEEKFSAQYFGVYNMVGKFSAILGPLLVGLTSKLTGAPRLSILVLLVFFALGAALLWFSRCPKRA